MSRLTVTSTSRTAVLRNHKHRCQSNNLCFNNGHCYFDPVLQKDMCRCPQNFTGPRCETPVRGMWLSPCPKDDKTECPSGGLCAIEPLMKQRVCVYNAHHIDTAFALSREGTKHCETKTTEEMMTSHARLYTLLGMVMGLCALVGIVVVASVLGWRHRKRTLAKKKAKSEKKEEKEETVVSVSENNTKVKTSVNLRQKIRSTDLNGSRHTLNRKKNSQESRDSRYFAPRNEHYLSTNSIRQSRETLVARDRLNAASEDKTVAANLKAPAKAKLQRTNSISSSGENRARSRSSSPSNMRNIGRNSRSPRRSNAKPKRSFSERGSPSGLMDVPSISISDAEESASLIARQETW